MNGETGGLPYTLFDCAMEQLPASMQLALLNTVSGASSCLAP